MPTTTTTMLLLRSSATATRRAAAQSIRFRNSFIPGAGLRFMSDLPYHHVVGMPALSPTMESGTLAEFTVKEGESFSAGDALANIETDKANMDFEAQDDGYVAKLLVAVGTQDIPVGTPIMVTVEEAEDVAAFADFTAPEQEVAAEASPEVKEEEEVPATPTPPPTPPPPAAVAPPTPAAVTPPPPPVEEAIVAAAAVAITAPTVGPAWGNLASVASPIAKTLSANQTKYTELYGTTGQVPL